MLSQKYCCMFCYETVSSYLVMPVYCDCILEEWCVPVLSVRMHVGQFFLAHWQHIFLIVNMWPRFKWKNTFSCSHSWWKDASDVPRTTAFPPPPSSSSSLWLTFCLMRRAWTWCASEAIDFKMKHRRSHPHYHHRWCVYLRRDNLQCNSANSPRDESAL